MLAQIFAIPGIMIFVKNHDFLMCQVALCEKRHDLFGDSWCFRLVSCLQRCLWHENQFFNCVNLLYQNQLGSSCSLVGVK